MNRMYTFSACRHHVNTVGNIERQDIFRGSWSNLGARTIIPIITEYSELEAVLFFVEKRVEIYYIQLVLRLTTLNWIPIVSRG